MKILRFLKRQSKALHLFMLMLLAAPMYVSAQQTLTIYPDATGSSEYVPIQYIVASYLKCEYVIPADQLEAMEEGTISKMTFHLKQSASGLESHNFQVFLREVDDPHISSYYGTSGSTIVYEGPLDGSQSTMDVTFTTPYTYHGGNLLVGFYKPEGSSAWVNVEFYGETVSGACVQGYNFSSFGAVTTNQRNFIPKTTFTYTAANNTCPKPKNLAISNVTNTSATLSWTQTGDASYWDVFYTDNPNYKPTAYTHPQFANVTDNPFTMTGLPSGRTYYVYVRANCGDEVGDWSSPCTFLFAEQITLNDGTATNQYVPVAGYYVSYSNTYGEFVLPATDLQGLVHAEIRQLTFYTDSPTDVSWGELYYVLTLSEGDFTEFNTTTSFGQGQQCFSGKISVIGNEMTLTFSDPYVYEGGNLLFYYYTYKPGTVSNVRTNWLGMTTQNTPGYGSSHYKYYTSSGAYYSTEGMQSFLPKTTIYYAFPECVKPKGFEASDITPNTATLSWTALGEGQNWEIQYRKADETDYTTVEGAITNPYTLQGLEPSHGYVARVRAVCGNDSYSDWLETTFYTDCTPITLPYSYGFEDVEGGGFPPCWTRYSTIEGLPRVNESTYGTYTGTHSLYLNGTGDEYTVMAVLPQIPVDAQHPISGNEMVFYAAGYYDPTSCQVGVMTDPNDPETFELVQEVEIPNGWYGGIGFLKYKVSFANYTGNGTYIAIRKVKIEGEDYASLYVDDLEVRPISDCMEPADLTVTATTSTTATLQWTANGTETAWQIQYKFENDEWPDTYQTVNQNPFTLEGLTQGRAYRARVKAVCSATETSDWTDYCPFITACAVPFFEDFGDSRVDELSTRHFGWQQAAGILDEVLAGTTQLEFITYGWQSGSLNDFTDNGMQYYAGYSEECDLSSSYYQPWFITPIIELGEGYQLNFDMALKYNQSSSSGMDDNRFAVLVTEDNGATWAVLALWDNDGTQGRAYYDIPAILNEVNIALPSTYDNKTVRFAFYGESTVYNNGTNNVYIDNVNVTKCIRPELIVASNITTNSAVLDWTTHGETSWTLQYRIDGFGNWNTVSNITAHPYTLEGLVSPNTYQVRVKAHNAAGDSEWSNIAIFSTDCAPINLGPNETYEQHFDGLVFPDCWSKQTISGSGGWSQTYDFYSDDYYCMEAFCHNSNGSLLADLDMPQITVTSGLCITFHHSTAISSMAHITAFVTLPSLDYEHITLWDSDTDDLSAGVTTISLNDYVGETVYFTFEYSSTGWTEFYIYDVTLYNKNTFNNNTENGYWNETANWSKGTVPGAIESVVIAGEAIIPNDCVAHADEILISNKGSLTIADGGQLEHNNAGVVATVQKSITPYTIAANNGEDKPNGWYLIASPIQNAVEPSGSFISNNFDLYRFNQSNELEWENYLQYFYLSPYFKLHNGQGYLYANNGNGTNDVVTIEIEGQLQPWGEEVEVGLDYAPTASFTGWNLVGNPFAHDVTSYTTTNVESGCFRMNDTHDNVMVSEVSASDPLKPMEGFFVKATGTDASITFNASRRGATNWGEGSIYVDVLQDGMAVDRLIVKDNERSPLEKFSLNQYRTKVFAIRDHREMSIVSRQGNEQAISFKAEKDGTYAFKVNVENMDLAYLHLIDNLTSNDVDLLALRQAQGPAEYTFEAKTSDYASRFRLVFISNETDGPSTGSGAFAFVNNGDIIILGDVEGATLQVIDVMGRVIACRDAARHVSTTEMTPGI